VCFDFEEHWMAGKNFGQYWISIGSVETKQTNGITSFILYFKNIILIAVNEVKIVETGGRSTRWHFQ
jgi:hypothetical protein